MFTIRWLANCFVYGVFRRRNWELAKRLVVEEMGE